MKFFCICSCIVLCLLSSAINGGALGSEQAETRSQSPKSPGFFSRFSSYFSKGEQKNIQSMALPKKKSPSELVHEKIISLQDGLKLLLQDAREISKVDQSIPVSKNEAQKNQLQKTSQALKQQLTTQKIPSYIERFTEFYITLAPQYRNSNNVQEFAKKTLESVNSLGRNVEGKYWQSYELLNEHELKRAQHRHILDATFNKNFNQILQSLQELYGDATKEGSITRNVVNSVESKAYDSIMHTLKDLASLDPEELSHESYLGVLNLQAYLSAIMGNALVSVFDHLSAQWYALSALSQSEKEDFLRDLKIDIKGTIKNSVLYQDKLDDFLRETYERDVATMRQEVKQNISSAYADLIARNKSDAIRDGELNSYVVEFDKAMDDAMRTIGNAEQLKKNREKMTSALNSFIATAKIADPSQVALIFISKIQNSLLKLVTTISRRGKEVKYGSHLNARLAYELVQTVIMALKYCAQLSVIRIEIRNMLTLVMDNHFVVMPYMKKDEARALIHDEKKPSDSARAMRLSVVRLPLDARYSAPRVPDITNETFPFTNWIMKGFERS
jgi:hypothetical protein